jgi:hypothetical protein
MSPRDRILAAITAAGAEGLAFRHLKEQCQTGAARLKEELAGLVASGLVVNGRVRRLGGEERWFLASIEISGVEITTSVRGGAIVLEVDGRRIDRVVYPHIRPVAS